MKRFVVFVLVAVGVVTLLAGCGNSTDTSVPKALLKSCNGQILKVSGGGAIAKAGSGQCISADHGATIIARGNAIVSAHGNSVIDAGNTATIVIYNKDVRCHLRGKGVTVINAIKSNFTSGVNSVNRTCIVN